MVPFIHLKKPPILLLYLLALLPFLFGIAYMIGFDSKAHAAVTPDNGSSPPNDQTWTPLTWQHTTSNFPNRILIVSTWTGLFAPPQPVTYNGIPLTKYKEIVKPYGVMTIWYLNDPPEGTYPITVIAPYGDSYAAAAAGASTFYNVDPTNPFGPDSLTSGTLNQGQNIIISDTLNNTTTNQLVVDNMGIFHYQPAVDPSAVGTGQTRHWFHLVTTLSKDSHLINGGSSKPADNGSTTMTWTTSTPSPAYLSYWEHIVFALNGIGSSTPTPTPTPDSTPTPGPSSGNITNLNFGISNTSPWMQVTCGDVRDDSGITNPLPVGQTMIATDTTCATPGIVYTGNTTASFGQGSASSTNQVVGGATYPEVYTQTGLGGLFSSFASIYAKAQTSGTQPTDLASICTLSDCTLPANLPHGIYIANSDLTLNAYTFPANQNYVILVKGNLTLNGNILAQTGTNSSLLITAAGNIIVPPTVGSSANTTTANLAGIFSTDKSFIMQSNNTCTDLRLNVEGTVIVNASLTGGTLQNNRDLCANNATAPTFAINQRLDFVLNLPDFLKQQSITSQEVAP